MVRTLARLVAAVTLAAAAYGVAPLAPAAAAGCSSGDGVTVVVDFHALGGGVQTACVAGGGGDTAADLFTAAGFSLTYVQRQPGFVCRVAGKPADNPCANTPPADAYWALFWSDGRSGGWTYATAGAGGQHVPDGGYVGFSWQGSDTRTAPGYAPAPHPTPAPDPTPAPTPRASPSTGHDGSSGHATGHPSATTPTTAPTTAGPSSRPTASGSSAPDPTPAGTKAADHKKRRSASPSPSASADPTQSASPAAAVASDPVDPASGGLPAWVAPAVVAVLLAAAGGVAVVRRRRAAP